VFPKKTVFLHFPFQKTQHPWFPPLLPPSPEPFFCFFFFLAVPSVDLIVVCLFDDIFFSGFFLPTLIEIFSHKNLQYQFGLSFTTIVRRLRTLCVPRPFLKPTGNCPFFFIVTLPLFDFFNNFGWFFRLLPFPLFPRATF